MKPAADELFATAKDDEYLVRGYRESDCLPDQKIKDQDVSVECYMHCTGRKEEVGTSAPTWRSWRGSVLCRESQHSMSSPPPIEDFVRFFITTNKGFVHDQATVDSVSIWLEWLFAALNRVARTATAGYERTESYLPVGQEGGLIVRKHKAKQLFTQQTLTTILCDTWADEDPVFIDERSAAQFMFFVLI
jgi:hypothetical protein